MAIATRNFSTIVSNAVAAMQGAAAALLDFSVGSVNLAFVQAFSGIALWLEAIALQVASLTRFSTSVGPDADSWAADYGFTRLGAVGAKGEVTFARFTATIPAQIPVGSIVQTSDGSEQFAVIADATQSTWNAATKTYILASNVASALVSVQAVTLGTAGNVAAGTVTVIGQSIVGIDTVTNLAGFSGGADAESDPAFKTRFIHYLQSLTEGTVAACINAVEGLQANATCAITENFSVDGKSQPGFFYAVVDDGTGNPSDDFVSACYSVIDVVRAEGTTFVVIRPTVVTVNISMSLVVAAGFTVSAVKAAVTTALTEYINTLGEGMPLQISRVPAVVYGASAGVSNVVGLTLNGDVVDIGATASQTLKIGTTSYV